MDKFVSTIAISSFLLLSSTNVEAHAAKLVEPKSIDDIRNNPPKKRDLWVMAQTADSVNQQSVCVSKGAIKFAFGDISVIAKAPDWKCKVLNERAKVFCELPMTELQGLKGVRSIGVKKWTEKENKKGELLNGQEIVCFEAMTDGKDSKASIVVLCSTANVPIEPGALHVLDRIYVTEGLRGIPLNIKMTSPSSDKSEDRLSTKWCLNRDFKEHIFEVPAFYAKVDKIADVESTTAIRTNRDRRPMTRSTRGAKKSNPSSAPAN